MTNHSDDSVMVDENGTLAANVASFDRSNWPYGMEHLQHVIAEVQIAVSANAASSS